MSVMNKRYTEAGVTSSMSGYDDTTVQTSV